MFPGGNSPPGKRQLHRKFAAGRNFLKSHTLLLEYKKKPFVPDAVPGLKLAKTAHMLLGLRPRPLGNAAYSAPHIPWTGHPTGLRYNLE